MEKRSLEGEARLRFWEHHLREWRESGFTQVEYCRKCELSRKSFTYWKRRLTERNAAVCLVEVPLQGDRRGKLIGSSGALRVLIGDRYRIEIERDFDPQALDQLMHFLDKR